MCEQCDRKHDADMKWLAMLLRQGLKVIVVGIERHYGLREVTQAQDKANKSS